MKDSYTPVKRIVVVLALLGSIASIVLILNTQIGLCKEIQAMCFWTLRGYGNVLFVFMPIFIFSLFTYLMSNKVHRTWLIFSVIWAPIVMYPTYLKVLHVGGSIGVYEDPGPVILIFGLYALYVIGSIGIIIWKGFLSHSK